MVDTHVLCTLRALRTCYNKRSMAVSALFFSSPNELLPEMEPLWLKFINQARIIISQALMLRLGREEGQFQIPES
jgi:hypothetical protein